ncbi:MAG: alpha/beta hydrolase [Minwuiales bacterium]|nr:alpha/beta hydrolase [Minwuiales bacterium]
MTSPNPNAARYETVTDAGPDAPWMTMVHGVSQDRRVFSAQVADFRGRFRLLLIDLPGHGLSTDIPGPYGLAEFASAIRATFAEVGVDRTHFWGTHLGAGAGLLLACREPGLFLSLVLEGPVFPGRTLPMVSGILARIAAIATEQGMDAARRVWWEEGAWFAAMRDNPACRGAEHRAIIEDFQGRPWLDAGLATRPIDPIDGLLAKLKVPVLIYNGEHDVPDFLQAADALEAALPACGRGIIPDAAGFPFWEFPDRVNAEVRSFLDSLPPSG